MKIKIYQPLAIRELGQRANQEDNIYPAEGEATEQDRLFILCDGMGGHEHGEVASQSVCRNLSAFVRKHEATSGEFTDEQLSEALSYAYGELDKLAVAGDTRQMGTTLALLYFHPKGSTAAHIGDSRIYHLRPATHTLLYKSRDHSLVYDLYQAGELSYEEMKTFPQKNVITRAMIAGDRNHPKPDVVRITDIQPGDYFFICSDGMLEQMEDEELLAIFSSDKTNEEKRQLLISKTENNRDNHSAYIVHIKNVEHDEADVSLVNEEPTAKCNALNIKPDVVEVSASNDVELVDVKPMGTPPPMPDSVVRQMEKRQKNKRNWFIAFIAFVIILAGGMAGYGYFTKQKKSQEIEELIDSLREDSLRNDSVKNNHKDFVSIKPIQGNEKDTVSKDTSKSPKDTLQSNKIQGKVNGKTTKNERNK